MPYPSPQDSRTMTEEGMKDCKGQGQGRPDQNNVFGTCQDHRAPQLTAAVVACIILSQWTLQHGRSRRPHPPNWRTMDSWRLLRERKSVFFKRVPRLSICVAQLDSVDYLKSMYLGGVRGRSRRWIESKYNVYKYWIFRKSTKIF